LLPNSILIFNHKISFQFDAVLQEHEGIERQRDSLIFCGAAAKGVLAIKRIIETSPGLKTFF
jgi:hypothetical protein